MSEASRRPVVGLMLPTAANLDDEEVDPGRTVRVARTAEEAGFDGVYVGDHLLHPRPLLESIVTLGVVAGATERVSLGPCVMLLALREPVSLAKQLGTLAAFAPGRLRVGVGVGGEYPPEFQSVGVPLETRGRQMEAKLASVRDLLSGRTTFGAGGDGATIAPAGEVPPFLLAGHKRAALRRAARCGEGWIGYFLEPAGFRSRREFVLEVRAELGAGSDPFVTGMLLPVLVEASGSQARARDRARACWAKLIAKAPGPPEELFAAGSAEEVADRLHDYWEAGCGELILAPADQGHACADQVQAIAEGLLPIIRSFA